jgi:hypothetical protein
MPPEHRRCHGVGDKHAPKLAVIVASNEANALGLRDHPQPVDPTIDKPHDGANVPPNDGLEQTDTLQLGQVDAAPMLAFAGSANLIGPT